MLTPEPGLETERDLCSRKRPELIAICFPAFEPADDFGVVPIGERGLKAMQFVLELTEGAQDLVTVLLEDRSPEMRMRRTE